MLERDETLLETATVTTGGADWGAYTSDHRTTNPYAQIGLATDEIVANDGNPSRIAMHDKVFRVMAANTNVKGLGGQGPNSTTSPGTAKTVSSGILPPGYEAYIGQPDDFNSCGSLRP